MRRMTIIVAVVATAFTIGAIIFWYVQRMRQEPTICDVAHKPSDCELLCREIYQNATNITEGVRENFTACMKGCRK